MIYSSFNHYSIQKIREMSPEAETAYLFGDVILHVEKYAADTGIRGLHPSLAHVQMADFLKEYQESSLAVRVWTVNDEKKMEELIRKGVDAVITNYPDLGLRARTTVEKETC